MTQAIRENSDAHALVATTIFVLCSALEEQTDGHFYLKVQRNWYKSTSDPGVVFSNFRPFASPCCTAPHLLDFR